MSAVLPRSEDLADIQGLVYSGWKDQEFAMFLLATFGADAAASRKWLAGLVGDVSHARFSRLTQTSRLQIAFSAAGLAALGVPEDARDGLPQEVKEGMASRRNVLRDDPSEWDLPRNVHVLVMLYEKSDAAVKTLADQHRRALEAAGATVYADEPTWKARQEEHFGFADGLSQPFLPHEHRTTPPDGQKPLAAGEIVLGYRNAYGHTPKGPQWDDFDLGKNGTYLVFRKLDQHVATFWSWLAGHAHRLANGDAKEAARLTEQFGAKVMGRWRSGASLVVSPDHDDKTKAKDNSFRYLRDKDEHGTACPIASHVRRANPRDGRGGSASDSAKVVERHRILRRGRSYGAPLSFEDAVAGRDDKVRRGLYFISLQASVARGFEFIQQTWLNNDSFHSLFGEADPITGGTSTHFTIPCDPLRLRLTNVPRVVTVAGGEYFFLPSLKALARIAEG